MSLLVTILARGGSKGVPNKNIRPLLGKPLIAHTIEQVRAWGKYDAFLVSTDSDQIAEIARNYGADVPFLRPPELASDDAPKIEALRDALVRAEEEYGKSFQYLLDLDPTAPIRQVAEIESIVALSKSSKADCVFSVVKAHKNPYFNMVEQNADGTVSLCKTLPGGVVRRQDVPTVYEMNASMYVYQRDFLMSPTTKMPYDGVTRVFEMDPLSGFDIDRELDFKLVEFVMKEGRRCE